MRKQTRPGSASLVRSTASQLRSRRQSGPKERRARKRREGWMSVQVDLYLAPYGEQSLGREAFLDVAGDLIRQKLVAPPYRVFQGGKGLAKGLGDATRLFVARKKPAK